MSLLPHPFPRLDLPESPHYFSTTPDTPSRLTMVLSAELIDHIFSFLQKYTLKTCSKALPLYSKLAKRHFYAHIFIDLQASELCDLILGDPHFLYYPRTLDILFSPPIPNPLAIPIMRMIPQMTNLISLIIFQSCLFNEREEFFSTLRNCLQQSSFRKLHLFYLYGSPLSVLDGAKNIKHLTLSDCSADTVDELISSLPPPQLSLETLILSGDFNPGLHRWATRWVTRLTTLELHSLQLCFDWTAFPKLLVACSNSLTRLHLDMNNHCYSYKLPFTFSALKRLKKLSISAMIIENDWALPEIIRVVNTAPAIPDVDLRFDCHVSNSITSLAQLDWSLLNHLLTGERPHINLCVTGKDRTPEDILNALAVNEVLMDLVKGGLVILGSEQSVSLFLEPIEY